VAKTTSDVSPERSAQMALVRGRDTKPEMRVRRALHAAGLRYRLHAKGLPGRPDLIFPSRRVVVFVHGCFWHRHPDPDCKLARLPKSRLDFWLPKLEGNRARDERVKAKLEGLGWKVIEVWECQPKPEDLRQLARRLDSMPLVGRNSK
jgi:DNA mismatch endonuclease (patch repair protein)